MDASGMRSTDDRDVGIVRWPAEADKRMLLASLGQPRLLLLEAGAQPPDTLDDREDWLSETAAPTELVMRVEALRKRASRQRPTIDEDGLLRYRGRWVAISDAQLPMVSRLVEDFGKVVPTDDLVRAYVAAGGTSNTHSMRTALKRVRHRVTDVGLVLRSIRKRGVILDDATS